MLSTLRLYSVGDKRMNMEHRWNETKQRKPNICTHCKTWPSATLLITNPICQQKPILYHVNPSMLKYLLQHQYCSSDTARCMQWVLYLLFIVQGVRGFQGMHKREDRAQSKLLRVLSAMRRNKIIFIVATWMGKRNVPALLPVLLSNERSERATSCFNVNHVLRMSGLVDSHETLHRFKGK